MTAPIKKVAIDEKKSTKEQEIEKYGLEINKVYNEDCLIGMQKIKDKSIDMILCDLPYGTTACKWDIIIPFNKLWEQYERIIKDNGAIVLTAKQPFSSQLISSNMKLFRQELIWLKTRPSNFMNAKKMYMNWHENVLIFYKKLPTFNRQMIEGKKRTDKINKVSREESVFGKTGEKHGYEFDNKGLKNPNTILEFSNSNSNSLHPTQKPIELFKHLIKIYSNKEDIILDNCMGSGTTAVASKQLDRKFIGFETDIEYYKVIEKRLSDECN